MAESDFIRVSSTYQTENAKIIDFLRDLLDRIYFYLAFCQEKDEESLKTRFVSEFTTKFSRISQRVF